MPNQPPPAAPGFKPQPAGQAKPSKPIWQRWWVIALAAFLLIGGIGSLLGGGRGSGTPQAGAPATATAPATEPAAPDVEDITEPDELKAALVDKLGASNREGVRRVESVKLAKGTLTIRWALNDNLTSKLRTGASQTDAVNILQTLHASAIDWDEVWLQGSFSMVDAKGNESESLVIRARYEPSDLADVNWENFNRENVWRIAQTSAIHQEFRSADA